MKRLFSVFSLAAMLLLGLALPHVAQAQATGCTNVNTNVATWPNGKYTEYCGTATQSDGSDMNGAFSPWSQNDAFDRLTFQGVIFYLFHTPTEFKTAVTNKDIVPAETYLNPTDDLGNSFIPNGYTVIVEQTDSNGSGFLSNYEIPNVTAHESGHWIDYLYEHAPNAAYIAVGGTKRTGDTVSVTITNANIVGSPLKVTYTVVGTDTLTSIANGLAAAVNQTAALNTSTVHIVASASATNISIDAVLPNNAAISTYTTAGTSYAVSVVGTETLTKTVGVLPASTNVDASDSTLWAHELSQDWTNFNALTACGNGAGIFSGRQDANLNYICTGNMGNGATLSATYSGKMNKAILQLIYPDIFNSGNHEIFAEEFAKLVGKTDNNYSEGGNPPPPTKGTTNPRSRDYYFQTQSSFQCTQALISNMTTNGVLPTTTQWPGNCPTQ